MHCSLYLCPIYFVPWLFSIFSGPLLQWPDVSISLWDYLLLMRSPRLLYYNSTLGFPVICMQYWLPGHWTQAAEPEATPRPENFYHCCLSQVSCCQSFHLSSSDSTLYLSIQILKNKHSWLPKIYWLNGFQLTVSSPRLIQLCPRKSLALLKCLLFLLHLKPGQMWPSSSVSALRAVHREYQQPAIRAQTFVKQIWSHAFILQSVPHILFYEYCKNIFWELQVYFNIQKNSKNKSQWW